MGKPKKPKAKDAVLLPAETSKALVETHEEKLGPQDFEISFAPYPSRGKKKPQPRQSYARMFRAKPSAHAHGYPSGVLIVLSNDEAKKSKAWLDEFFDVVEVDSSGLGGGVDVSIWTGPPDSNR